MIKRHAHTSAAARFRPGIGGYVPSLGRSACLARRAPDADGVPRVGLAQLIGFDPGVRFADAPLAIRDHHLRRVRMIRFRGRLCWISRWPAWPIRSRRRPPSRVWFSRQVEAIIRRGVPPQPGGIAPGARPVASHRRDRTQAGPGLKQACKVGARCQMLALDSVWPKRARPSAWTTKRPRLRSLLCPLDQGFMLVGGAGIEPATPAV